MENKKLEKREIESNRRCIRYFSNRTHYDGFGVSFKLVRKKKQGEGSLKLITELMAEAGFILEIQNDELTITVDGEKLSRVKHSMAGRPKKAGEYRFSDIVPMMQTMTDKEIAEKIGMPMATYYRHKKALKNSLFYRSLDKKPEKLIDSTYLETIQGNEYF